MITYKEDGDLYLDLIKDGNAIRLVAEDFDRVREILDTTSVKKRRICLELDQEITLGIISDVQGGPYGWADEECLVRYYCEEGNWDELSPLVLEGLIQVCKEHGVYRTDEEAEKLSEE